MKIGLYGATGSWDFGDYAMMIHNVQEILNESEENKIVIFTPDKYITLKNLVDNLLDIELLKRIQIVDEPYIRRSKIEKAIDYIYYKMFGYKKICKLKYKRIINGDINDLEPALINNIKDIDLLIFNGGGYLQHSWGEKNLLFALLMIISKQFGKNVYMLGNSIGPMQKWEYCIKDALPYVSEIMIRDGRNYTAKLLDKYGYKNYFCGPDDLFFVNEYYDSKAKYEKYVVIEIMFWIEKAKKGGKYVEQCLQIFVDYLIDTDLNIVFTIFDNEDHIAISYMERIKENSKKPQNISIIKHIDTIYQIFSLYKHCLFSLSFKYHPLILALGSNRPCIGVVCDNDGYYESKFMGACENVGADPQRHIIHINDIDDSILIHMYEQIRDSKNVIEQERYNNLFKIRNDYTKRILANEELNSGI